MSEVPSVQELGQKKLVAENFLGISGPAGLPREVVARIHAANKKALADPKGETLACKPALIEVPARPERVQVQLSWAAVDHAAKLLPKATERR